MAVCEIEPVGLAKHAAQFHDQGRFNNTAFVLTMS